MTILWFWVTVFSRGSPALSSVVSILKKSASSLLQAKPISLVLTLVTRKSETGRGAEGKEQTTRFRTCCYRRLGDWTSQNIYTEIKCTLGNIWPFSLLHIITYNASDLATGISGYWENGWLQEHRNCMLSCTKVIHWKWEEAWTHTGKS